MVRLHGMKNFPIVHDDLNAYAKKIMEPEQERLFQLCRNNGIDNLFTTHSWAQTPVSILDYIHVIFLGATSRGPIARRAEFNDDEILARHEEWKRKADAFAENLPENRQWDHPWLTMDFEGREVKNYDKPR